MAVSKPFCEPHHWDLPKVKPNLYRSKAVMGPAIVFSELQSMINLSALILVS